MTSRIRYTCSLNDNNNNYNYNNNNDENDNLSERDFFELCKKKFLNKNNENVIIHQNGKNFSCDHILISSISNYNNSINFANDYIYPMNKNEKLYDNIFMEYFNNNNNKINLKKNSFKINNNNNNEQKKNINKNKIILKDSIFKMIKTKKYKNKINNNNNMKKNLS